MFTPLIFYTLDTRRIYEELVQRLKTVLSTVEAYRLSWIDVGCQASLTLIILKSLRYKCKNQNEDIYKAVTLIQPPFP